MMDQNRPARALDTAYNALKANPAATNQIMQAAAQGAPVGLKGLAAAAAQQSQQQAQQAMAALQQRGPQPNVIQQLAHAGIMSQMDTGLPGAPVQEEIPQMMAGGGLVAFADGGNVLPPDVIEAIQSHFAEGGDVRGFFEGKDVFLTDAAEYGAFKPLPGASEDTGLLPKTLREIRGKRVGRGGIPSEEILSETEELFTPEKPIAVRGRGAFSAKGLDNILSTLGVTEFSPTGGMYKPEILKGEKEAKPKAKLATWQPEPHDGHEVTPRQEVHPEGQKLDKSFDEAKKDVPSAAATPGIAGLGAGVDMEKMRDLIIGLRGRKEMSPEIKAKLEDLESGARTSTILQSLLGGLGGGLSSPYGGRFALGKAALGALSGYQHGIGSEEEMNRNAFNILKGYADAPAEEQAKAVDMLFGQLGKAAELQAQRDIAEAKGMNAMERLLLSERGKYERYGLGRPTTDAQLAQMQNLALDNAQKEIDTINKQRENAIPAKPPLTDQEKSVIVRKAFLQQQQYVQSGGADIGLGGGTLGGGQLGSRPPIIQ